MSIYYNFNQFGNCDVPNDLILLSIHIYIETSMEHNKYIKKKCFILGNHDGNDNDKWYEAFDESEFRPQRTTISNGNNVHIWLVSIEFKWVVMSIR